MKKFFALALALIMTMSLVACGAKEEAPAAPSTPAAPSAPAAPAAPEKKPAADPIAFKVSLTQASTDPLTKFVTEMCEELNETMDGVATFEVHANGELGTLADVTEMAQRGAAVITWSGIDYFNAVAPELGILNAQYALSSADQIQAVNDSEWFKEQVQLVADGADLKLMGWNWFTGYRHMISSFPINHPDDIAGLKMRVADSPALIAFSKALNTAPIITNWNEVYNGLSQGMVDFAEAPLSTLYASSLYEVADHIALTYNTVSVPIPVMSQTLFDSLPAEYQQIMWDTFWAYGEKFTEDSLNSEADYIAKFEAEGVTFTQPDVPAFIAEAADMFEDLGMVDAYNAVQEIIA